MSGPLVLVRDEGPVRWLTLNRPDQRNALGAELVSELGARLAEPGGARCLAITGAGNAFSAGADLRALQRLADSGYEANLADSQLLADLFRTIAEHPLPVLAAVNGPALGGGAGLVVACDFALAAPGAVIGFPEVRVGFVPAIVLNFLIRAVGEPQARRLCLTGARLGAAEAAALGLVTVAPDLGAGIAAVGAELAKASPAALAHTKRLFPMLRHLPLADGLRLAAEENARARATDDCREGIAAFLEKRKPEWKGTP